LEYEALAFGLSGERSCPEALVCPQTHRIFGIERSVLFLRRLACQNQLHSFPKHAGFGDDTARLR
jgi:hypothetical protein